MFTELAVALALFYNCAIDEVMNQNNLKQPRSLVTIAADKIRTEIQKNPKLLNQFPEELYPRLGFIRIPKSKQENENSAKIYGVSKDIVKINDNEYLNLTNIEHFSGKSFKELVKENLLILAIVTVKDKDNYTHNYYEASRLHEQIFTYQGSEFKDPKTSKPIFGRIHYFCIAIPSQFEAIFLGTDVDIFQNPDRKELMLKIFASMKSDMAAYWEIVKIAAEYGITEAQFLLGNAYQRMPNLNIEKAKHYLKSATLKNHAASQAALGLILYNESCIEQTSCYKTKELK